MRVEESCLSLHGLAVETIAMTLGRPTCSTLVLRYFKVGIGA
jgi:hypothetical protein